MNLFLLLGTSLIGSGVVFAQHSEVRDVEYTVAGAKASSPNGSRQIIDMNRGWKTLRTKDNVDQVEAPAFDDKQWEIVNLPHGTELLPEEASGCMNYQGPIYYRKSFEVPSDLKGKRVTLHFEGIMGKSKIWVNGKLVKEHLGGYLPIIVDVSKEFKYGQPNMVVISADNSNDPSFPPGKSQETLDFTYFGGAYRDAYLIATEPVYITDANEADTVAGGGIFFRTEKYNPQTGNAATATKIQVANDTDTAKKFAVRASLNLPGKKSEGQAMKIVEVPANGKIDVDLPIDIKQAKVWSPKSPNLYDLTVQVLDPNSLKQQGKKDIYDERVVPVGIRMIEFDSKGFHLNGKPYEGKLIGVNRHQDFAVLGNAVPNNLQWQDAVKLRQAGVEVVRSAHYPMDPAFMDACDRLGIFVIVATPGWQFWGTGNFKELVYNDIRQMVRRDRNHPSVLLWEPILNETSYPGDFAKKTHDLVKEEYPYPGNYTACDSIAQGVEHFDVIYGHPRNQNLKWSHTKDIKDKPYFTREFGDNVDDWSSHNSSSRVTRNWGEHAMLKQAIHYMKPSYPYTCLDTINKTEDFHFGGALWHSFDHQRGYHPDPFYGGIMDAFRQPKLSYYGFMSQRPASADNADAAGPMVFIANECTPFSPEDVTVFSNCDEVRLTVNNNKPIVIKPQVEAKGIKHPPIVFEKAWNFQDFKDRAHGGNGTYTLVAEGLINGKVVAKQVVEPARRPAKIQVRLDNNDIQPTANGADTFVVVAEITDEQGRIKRLNNEEIEFSVEGPAFIVGDESVSANPKKVSWGSAPVLVRMGETPGTVKVHAKLKHPGSQKPISGEVVFETKASTLPSLQKDVFSGYSKSSQNTIKIDSKEVKELKKQLEKTQSELNKLKNKEVEKQQTQFQ